MSLSVKPLANAVAGTDFIVAIVDGPITSKMYSGVSYTVASTLPALGSTNYTLGLAPGLTGFPKLNTLTAVSASDGTNTELGFLKVTLTPDAGDVINASSPMTDVFTGNAIAVTASSATG